MRSPERSSNDPGRQARQMARLCSSRRNASAELATLGIPAFIGSQPAYSAGGAYAQPIKQGPSTSAKPKTVRLTTPE